MSARAVIAASLALAAVSARAEIGIPARSGESGILDVPDASVVGDGRGLLGAELRLDRVDGQPTTGGPFPIYLVAGLNDSLEAGLSMREWGQPGDPLPGKATFGAAAKLRLWESGDALPSLAVGFVLDRINTTPIAGGRLIASTSPSSALRLAAFVGGETPVDGGKPGLTWGAALAVPTSWGVEPALEGVSGPRGLNLGGAIRWAASKTYSIQAAVNYLPDEKGMRFSLGIGIQPPPRRPAVQPTGPLPEELTAAPALEPIGFSDPRPHFRLRIPVRDPAQRGEPAHAQHGPATLGVAGATAAAAAAKPEAGAARAVAPSLEDLAEAQLAEQESLADARERRIRATADQLETREKTVLDQRRQQSERERALAEREQQLEARERRIAFRGPPTQQQRQLESLEAQLASQERSLAAQERSYGPALDAAEGRERDAAAREEAERAEAKRLAASVSAAPSRAAQIDVRKQAIAARNRQLAGLEARLVAKGELNDALDRQLRTRGERVDAWSRRLDTRTERLDLLENLGPQPKSTSAPQPAAPAGAAPPKDKAAFVMVVKSPTAVVKESPASAGAAAAGPGLHSGTAVEKAVAAATVLMFPTPSSQLSELDAEALANIAKLAARESCELLIWARAKDASAMAEAQRRATEIQTRALAAAPLDPSRVTSRITTRPGARGVDVVVSALRESAKPAAAPAAAETPKLLAGESGTRQLREAVQAAQGSIEACVGELVEARRLSRAEGVLKLTVGRTGRVTGVTTGAGDISGTQVEECLNAASRTWLFPAADGEYAVDVPLTVMRGGATR